MMSHGQRRLVVLMLATLTVELQVRLILCASGDFFGRQAASERCSGADDSVRRCLSATYDRLEAVERELSQTRAYLAENALIVGKFERELIGLHAALDQQAGLESIVTHLLLEDCGEQPESGWNERDCLDDAKHIPKFEAADIAQTYANAIADILLVHAHPPIPILEEAKISRAIHLLGRLSKQLADQTELRHEIKGGFWLRRRYSERRRVAFDATASLFEESQ